MMRRRGTSGLTAIAVVLAAVWLAAACGSSASTDAAVGTDESGLPSVDILTEPSGLPRPGGALVMGISAETNSWSPVAGQWGAQGYQVARTIFDPLAAFDENTTVKPYLAEAIESNDDFTQWRITVRPGVMFHDDTPVDAAAVAKNLQAQKASALTGQAFAPIDQITTEGERVVVVAMKTPWSSFAGYLTSQLGFIGAPAMLDDEQGGSNPIGSGPFRFDTWKPDSSLLVQKNDQYWQAGRPLLEQIEFRVLVEELSRVQSLPSGDVDVAELTQPEGMLQLAGQARNGEFQFLVDRRGTGAEIVLPLNTRIAPFDDVDARRAVAHAIDKESMSSNLFLGAFPATYTGLSGSSAGRAEVTDFPTYDPERAQQLAERYEQTHGEPISFSLIAPSSDPQILQIAQFIQANLAEVGIEMEIPTVDQSALLAAAFTGSFEAIGFKLFGGLSYESVNLFLDGDNAKPAGQFSLNLSGLADSQIDASLDALRGTSDSAEITSHDQAIDRRLGQAVPYLYLVRTVGAVAASNQVHGFQDMTLPDGSRALTIDGTLVWPTALWIEP